MSSAEGGRACTAIPGRGPPDRKLALGFDSRPGTVAAPFMERTAEALPCASRVASTSQSANPTFQKWLRLVAIPERPAARGPLTGARGLAWALAWKE